MFFRAILAGMMSCLVLSGPVCAQESKKILNSSRLLISVSTWLSKGRTDWNHDASGLPTGAAVVEFANPTSELTYQDQDSTVLDFQAEWRLPRRYFIRASGGFGGIGDGRLFDDDNLVVLGTSEFPTSRTVSNIGGNNLWYINAEIGRKLFKTRDGKGWFRPFIGYQHWRETSVASGVVQTVCTQPGVLCNPVGSVSNQGERVVTNTVQWDSLSIGIDGEYRLTRNLAVSGYAAFIPYSDLGNEDIHHLRDDLQKQPSFRMDGTGIGFNLQFNASYQVTRNISFEAGYRFWRLQIDDGNFRSFPVSGNLIKVNLNDLDSQRYGTTIGLTYQF